MTISVTTEAELGRRLAGISPSRLMGQWLFWRHQPELLTLIAVVIGMGWWLAAYTYQPGHIIETLVVQALGIWALILTIRTLARLQVETAVVSEVEARGAAYLSDLKSRRQSQIELDRLEERVIPPNPAQPPLASIRLFQHIANEARDRRFDSSMNLMQPYREEALADVFRLQNLQKIALWLGILGTFVGLLLAVRQIDFERVGTAAALVEAVRPMFVGLRVAFTASIAGLEAAILVGLLIIVLRRRQERYFKGMETAVDTMLSVARRSLNRDELLTELTTLGSTIGGLSTQVENQTRDVVKRMDAVGERVSTQSDHIQAGLKQLGESRREFDAFLKDISKTQADFFLDIRHLYEAVSLKELGQTLSEGVTKAGQEVTDRFVRMTEETSNGLLKFNQSILQLTTATQGQTQQYAAAVKAISEGIASSHREQTSALRNVIKPLQDDYARQAASNQKVSVEIHTLSNNIVALVQALERSGYVVPKRRSWWVFWSASR